MSLSISLLLTCLLLIALNMSPLNMSPLNMSPLNSSPPGNGNGNGNGTGAVWSRKMRLDMTINVLYRCFVEISQLYLRATVSMKRVEAARGESKSARNC